jgi:branched-subunit amino acid transport protein
MSAIPMALGLIILGMGLVTYVIRVSPIVLMGRVRIPPVIQQELRFVPPAVLSAIIVPELLRPSGTLNLALANPRLLAGFVAALVVWRTRNVFLAIAIGMLAFWVLQVALAH